MSLFVFNGFIQAAQNGPSGGLGVDTALCQQGAAVSYSQKGNTFSGLDVSSFKPQTDVRISPLPGAGAALMGTFPAGWLLHLNLNRNYSTSFLWSNMLSACSCSFIWRCNAWIGGGAAACHYSTVCTARHIYSHTSPTGAVLYNFLVWFCSSKWFITYLISFWLLSSNRLR